MNAHRELGEIKSTLATLAKMAADIAPDLYAEDAGEERLRYVLRDLLSAEDALADICARNVEAQEGEEHDDPTGTYIEMGTHAQVEVVRWDGNTAHLADGTTAERRKLYPPEWAWGNLTQDWLIDAERNLADAADERDTAADARYGGCR